MADSGKEDSREQHNYGSGPFIGRDNYGEIRYEMLDAQTKAVLAKLSKDAPDLATLLKKALRDGVISPDAVAALESAVRNINEDVAMSLMLAGRNINEDVAMSLEFAGRNINEDVANKILQAVDTLNETMRQLDYTVEKVSATEGIEYVVAPSPSRAIDDWKARVKLFLWSAGIGLLAGILLTYYLIKR